MSKLKEATFWKRRDDRPPEIEMMADWFAEHDWTLVEEWIDPWYDEEEDEHHEGWWCYTLMYEEMIGEQLHAWYMSPIRPSKYPEIWENDLKLGRMGWERYRESVA